MNNEPRSIIPGHTIYCDCQRCLDRLRALLAKKEKEIESLKQNGVIKSCDDYFKIKPGMQAGRIWIESTGGEGGDFDQDELFMHIREFYDKRF